MFNHFGKTGQFSISQLFFYLERLPARCYINGRARREREGEREREREREREGGELEARSGMQPDRLFYASTPRE